MSSGAPISHLAARMIAQELKDELRYACVVDRCGEGVNPMFGCEKCVIAGSLRRQKPEVHDIELVLEPQLPLTLFGAVDEKAPTDLDSVLDRLVRIGRLERRMFPHPTPHHQGSSPSLVPRWGPRYKGALAIARVGMPRIERPTPIPVDLFIVRPPASFAAILAIRTGPADFSKRLVTKCQEKGRRLVDGQLVDRIGTPIPTPTERDFFEACGVPWVEPEDRR